MDVANIFVREVVVGLFHTENLMIKKLREVRETNGLELDEPRGSRGHGEHLDHGQRLHLVRQDQGDPHNSRYEFQRQTRGQF